MCNVCKTLTLTYHFFELSFMLHFYIGYAFFCISSTKTLMVYCTTLRVFKWKQLKVHYSIENYFLVPTSI